MKSVKQSSKIKTKKSTTNKSQKPKIIDFDDDNDDTTEPKTTKIKQSKSDNMLLSNSSKVELKNVSSTMLPGLPPLNETTADLKNNSNTVSSMMTIDKKIKTKTKTKKKKTKKMSAVMDEDVTTSTTQDPDINIDKEEKIVLGIEDIMVQLREYCASAISDTERHAICD